MMKRPRPRTLLLVGTALLVSLALLSPSILSAYWRVRSSNPIRRGIAHAQELGCFSCHGELGRAGIPIPGDEEGVPQWNSSVWMMYVKTDAELRQYIADGSLEHEGIVMPAYGDLVDDSEMDDLVATFKVLAGMVRPERGSPARSGYNLARDWGCFACHGPAGSGGLSNPGSFTGFVPGWYGADYADLVRDRAEFDSWILEGSIPRMTGNPLASYFLERQSIAMPSYRELTAEQLESLWAYSLWLAETDGGHRGEIAAW